jgi:ribonuclease BN (tRNA processing enzyme)
VTAGLSLTVLGCDGSFPGPGGAGSGYLLTCEGTNVWLDAGPGTLANIQKHVPLAEIDAIVISHEHIDHWSDLEHLAVACKWIVARPPVPLYCEADIPSLMRTPASDQFDRRAVGPGSKLDIGAMTFTFSRTDHSVATLAVRVDGGGRSLGYSADSGPGWGLSDLGPGLDLALCEATFLSDREGSLPHMSARQAGHSARRAGVRQLVLTHLWPGVDREAVRAEGRAAFGGPVELAQQGLRFEP